MSTENVLWEPLKGSQTLAMVCPADEILYHGTRGPGKRVSSDTPVLTESGWKRADAVTYADKLCALDGSWAPVTGIFPCADRDLWAVQFHDGAVVLADDEHRWLVLNGKTGYREGWKVRTTQQLRSVSSPYYVPYLRGAVQGKQWCGPDPYVIGYLIANGTTGSKNLCVYSIDDEILHWLHATYGWALYQYEQTAKRAVCLDAAQETAIRELLGHRVGAEKRIPASMLTADVATRTALLQGLMDGDGNVESGAKARYSTVSEQLAQDVVYLVKSLGGWASYRKQMRPSPLGGADHIFRVNISHHNQFNPFRLERKAARVQAQTKFLTRGIASITYAGKGDGVCFAVDHPDHCFIVGDFVVTHNTDWQLMFYRKNVGQGFGGYWRGIIVDRAYKNLDDMVAKSKKWFYGFNDGAKFLSGKSDYKWVWPTGEELLFRQVANMEDYLNFHGQEFPYIGWNELTKYPSGELYEEMMSCNRSSFLAPPGSDIGRIPLVVTATTNPSGPGHNWVRKYFIDNARPGQLVRKEINVFNPQTQQRETIVRTRCHIFGSYKENKYLDPKYVAQLESITDPNKRRAWLHGDWTVVGGGALDDVWGPHNIVPRFKIPSNWHVDRSFDWGSSHPFSVGWWAEANGEEVALPNGALWAPPRGSLFRFYEWYGAPDLDTNKGVGMHPYDLAVALRGMEERLVDNGWCNELPAPGPADNQIWNMRDPQTPTIADEMLKAGVGWTTSDKSKGSRATRLVLMRQMLNNARTGEGPGLFFMENCRAAQHLLPTLPRDPDNPDDVDTTAADHLYDEAGYRVLSSKYRASLDVEERWPT